MTGSAAGVAAVGVGLWQGLLQLSERRRREEPRQRVRSHLPPDIREFSDRAAELDKLEQLVGQADGDTPTSPKAVIVYGKPGVGKSALANHFVHQRSVRDRYPDAQLYLDLQDRRGNAMPVSEALRRLCRALDIREEAVPLDVEERKGAYRAALSRRRALVLLDNAVSPEQVQALLPANPDCLVLVTSRGPLVGRGLIGVHRLELQVMDRKDSLALMRRIAGDSVIDADRGAAEQVAHLCGDLPLAISMAAAQLRSGSGLTVREQSQKLGEARRVLGTQVLDPAVRTSFEVGYQRLTDEARTLWRRLRLLVDRTLSAPVAAALIGCDVGRAQELLKYLAEEQLLERLGNETYAFHELIGVFADEKLNAEPAEQRHGAFERALRVYLNECLPKAAALDPEVLTICGLPDEPRRWSLQEQLEVLSWFERHREMVVGTMRRATELGAPSVTWQLGVCLAPMFELRGYLDDWVVTQGAAMQAARMSGDLLAQGWVRVGLGHLHFLQGRNDADQHLQAALEIAQDRGLPRLEARAQYLIARMLHQSRKPGSVQHALNHYSRAFELYQAEQMRQEQVSALYGAAIACRDLGDVDDEFLAQMIQRALSTLTRMDEEVWVLRSIGTLKEYLGLVYQNLGDLGRAGANHVGSTDAFRRIGLRHGLAHTLRNLGRLRMRQESWGQAAEVLEESFQTFKAMSFRYEEARTLELLGETLRRAEGPSAARVRWADALKIYISLDCPSEAENVRGRIEAVRERPH